MKSGLVAEGVDTTVISSSSGGGEGEAVVNKPVVFALTCSPP